MTKEGDWVVNYDGRVEWTDPGRFASREDALAAGQSAAVEWGSEWFEVGQVELHAPCPPDADDIIEHMVEQANGEGHSDYSDGWLDHVPKEEREELSAAVADVVLAWLKRHKRMPDFYLVQAVERHEVATPAAA